MVLTGFLWATVRKKNLLKAQSSKNLGDTSPQLQEAVYWHPTSDLASDDDYNASWIDIRWTYRGNDFTHRLFLMRRPVVVEPLMPDSVNYGDSRKMTKVTSKQPGRVGWKSSPTQVKWATEMGYWSLDCFESWDASMAKRLVGWSTWEKDEDGASMWHFPGSTCCYQFSINYCKQRASSTAYSY